MKQPAELGVVLPSHPGEAHRNGGRLVVGSLRINNRGLTHQLRGLAHQQSGFAVFVFLGYIGIILINDCEERKNMATAETTTTTWMYATIIYRGFTNEQWIWEMEINHDLSSVSLVGL